MVLVRKSELACRNQWDQDLWEAVAPGDLPAGPFVTPEVPAPFSTDSGFLPVVSAHAVDEPLRTGDLHTDKVTSISMPLRPLRPRADQPMIASTVDDDPSGPLPPTYSPSVREARRRRQELKTLELRKQHDRLVSDASRLLEDDIIELPVRELEPVSVRPRERDLVAGPPPRDPVPPGERRAPRWPIAQPPLGGGEQTIRFGSEPDVLDRGERRPAAARPAAPLPEPRLTEPPRPPSATRGFEKEQTEELPKVDATAASTPPQSAAPVTREPARRNPITPGTTATRQQAHAPISTPVEPAIPPREPRWVPPAGTVPVARPASREAGDRPMPVDPLDTSGRLKAIPRCCGTCRDFKRVGDGDRGWCTNAYAFREQRMVESDSLACRSSMGVLWLPHDDVWLERADTNHHGRPTPLLDQFVQEGHLAGVSELEPRST